MRVTSKIRRLQFHKLCMHFDWMDGTSAHVPASQLTLFLKLVLTCCCIGALQVESGSPTHAGLVGAAAVIFTSWFTLQVCMPLT